MDVRIYSDRETLSRAAAAHVADALRACLRAQDTARIIAATGASQIEFLEALTATDGIEWSRVEMFHLDEYVGLALTHPAGFRRYLRDRLIDKVGIGRYHLLDGEADPDRVAQQAGDVLAAGAVDVAFVGIGENGHLAFNDPPADFTTERPYVIVTLDDACRRQQVGEGWFASIDDVPTRAISMSVRQILKSREIVAVVPDARKANAVKACVEGPVSPMAPASILQTHANTTLYLDRASAALLTETNQGISTQSRRGAKTT
jgi:glucosamine-6-phosphate deaminase